MSEFLYVYILRSEVSPDHYYVYPVQLPEPRIDGVTFQRSTKLLRIDG